MKRQRLIVGLALLVVALTVASTAIMRAGSVLSDLALRTPDTVAPAAHAQQPQAYYDRIVYITSGGIFHRKDCQNISGRETRAIRVGDLPSDATECTDCKPLDVSRDPVPVVKALEMSFVVGSPMVIRSGASATSPGLATAQPLDVLVVEKATEGWLKIVAHGRKQVVDGWIAASNLDTVGFVDGSWLEILVRRAKLDEQPWPVATKVDVLRKRVRIGFTYDQVTFALGRPLRRTTVETAQGQTETWLYPGRSVLFTLGKVTSIVTTEMP